MGARHRPRPTAVLLTGELDETVRAWLPNDLAALGYPTQGHALGVVALAAHPAGVLAAAVSLDSYIRVFDVDTGRRHAGGAAIRGLGRPVPPQGERVAGSPLVGTLYFFKKKTKMVAFLRFLL